ncbi:DUF3122 domain-containing protein [Microcoleus sp. herbarium12]|uniref:DUF3122 domain-containing protein n=1 Tax=Microcoleus sp. herbarium12 TaxID=3055437 RepID=UPI002FD270DB
MKNHKSWRKILTIISLCLYLILAITQPVFASIHKYPERADRVMFRSVQSLRDTDDRAWQVVLYKRVQSGLVNSFNLRLVGFPGTELQHPVPLNVAAGSRKIGKANDIWSESDLPINVGEYDFKSIITQVESNQPLRLSLPVKGAPETELLVPPFAVREWRLLLDTK